MKILFLNAYFFPEVISFTHLEQDLLKALTARGHKIYVVCPIPTRGISAELAQKYQFLREEEMEEGLIHVERFWAPKEGRNLVARAFRYIWCNIREYQIAKKYKDVDLIFATSTPPTQGYVCAQIKKKMNIPFLYNLQDIFPDSLISTGISKEKSILWRIGRLIEKYTYKYADRIITISGDFKKNLLKKGVPEEKIDVIYNWINSNNVVPVERRSNTLFDEFKLDRNNFYITYAGNLGEAQGIETILHAAELLQDNHKIQFVIFGSGVKEKDLKAFIAKKQLNNIYIFPLQPQNRVSEVYSLGNVSIVTCKKRSGISAFPSKTWSIMSAGCPVLASFDLDSELCSIIRELCCGLCVEAENPQALANAIQELYLQKNLLNMWGNNGRDYVRNYLNAESSTNKYIEIMQQTKLNDKGSYSYV